MRLIDADGLYDGICDMTGSARHTVISVENVLECIEGAPTVDAEPVVHARWIEHVHVDEFGDCCYIDQECSHCHVTELFVDDGVRAFCPNCGSKMDGGVSDATD